MKKIFLFILVLIIISCKNAESGNQKEILTTNKIELEILSLLPSEYFEKGYSRAGYLEGDAQIFFTKDALNVSYLINGQSIMEKGTPLNIILTQNNAGKKILKGEWDNHTAGDGIFIVYLDKGNIVVQIEGKNGATWRYKAENKVDEKLYKKLIQLFYGNVNYKEDEIMNDSIKEMFTEKIKKTYETRLVKTAEGRNIKMNVIFGDLNNDGLKDALLEYCIEKADYDMSSNALLNSDCWHSGFAVFIKKEGDYFLKADISKEDLELLDDDFIYGFYKAEKIKNGTIFFSSPDSQNEKKCFLYKNNRIIKSNKK